jgi:hypothetical protein
MRDPQEPITYIWYKTDINGIRKNIAILAIFDTTINSLIDTYGGNSPVVWLHIAVALCINYPGIFPFPIWDDWGNLNAFWGSNNLERSNEIDETLPVFQILGFENDRKF